MFQKLLWQVFQKAFLFLWDSYELNSQRNEGSVLNGASGMPCQVICKAKGTVVLFPDSTGWSPWEMIHLIKANYKIPAVSLRAYRVTSQPDSQGTADWFTQIYELYKYLKTAKYYQLLIARQFRKHADEGIYSLQTHFIRWEDNKVTAKTQLLTKKSMGNSDRPLPFCRPPNFSSLSST